MINRIIIILKSFFDRLNMDPDKYVFRRRIPADEGRERYKRAWVNVLLFIATFATTTFAGTQSLNSVKEFFLTGLPFSVSIMSILLAHEMGHYLAARHFNVCATLPFFIPFPVSIIGTMGAVIKIKSPIRSRKALFYIGAMGPVAGFCLSILACIIGIYLSQVKPSPVGGNGLIPVFGDSLLFSMLVRIFHGAIPAGHDIYLSPYAWAGWIGLLITGLNLMPIGQLDGGHILYSLVGRKQLYFGWAIFIALIVLSFFWPGWVVWIALTLILLKIGHPPVEENEPLSLGEKITGWACMVIFVLVFIPEPVKFI